MDVLFPSQNIIKDKETDTEQEFQPALIKVIGVGGGGVNAVNSMIDAKVSNVEFYAVNTDAAHLRWSRAENKIQIGSLGQGVGGDPQRGEECANESEEALRDMLSGADMVFITTGMGGGTGTGAAPVIAKLAKEAGILTVGVVTKPFTAEGDKRIKYAERGIKSIKQYVDALIVIPNDRIYTTIDINTPLDAAFKIVDDRLRVSIKSITDTITKIGTINIDFSDVKSVLKDSENAVIGLGNGETCEEAFKKAVSDVFVEGPDIKESNNILINISSSNNNSVTVADMKFINDSIKKDFINSPTVKIGIMISNILDNRIQISIIASFSKKEKVKEDLFDGVGIEQVEEKKTVSSKIDNKNNKIPNDDEALINTLFSVPACDFWKIKRLK